MKNALKASAVVLAMMVSSVALAVPATDLPVDAVGFFADIKVYAEKTMTYVWPIALVIIGGFTALKLVKKGVGKST